MQMSLSVTGLKELTDVLEQMADEIGDKKVNSKILVPAVREAMQPVLRQAQAAAPMDTGGLKLSLQVEARRPSRKDKRSKYVMNTDTVIAAVTTASGKKLAVVVDKTRLRKDDISELVCDAKKIKSLGIKLNPLS
jgi:hypothetical protein